MQDITKPDLPRRGAIHSPQYRIIHTSLNFITPDVKLHIYPSTGAKLKQVISFIVARCTIPVSFFFGRTNRDPTLLRSPCGVQPIPIQWPICLPSPNRLIIISSSLHSSTPWCPCRTACQASLSAPSSSKNQLLPEAISQA